MVERSVSCRVDRTCLSVSEHGYNLGRQAPYRNHSSHALSGSHHGSSFRQNNLYTNAGNSNSLGGSSHHNRGCQRNKSFNKPKLTASNSGFDPLGGNSSHSCRSTGSSFQHSYKKPVMPQKHQYVAMDCEMVGTVTGESVAARVVLIDWKGRAVLDSYMKPNEAVADYRTFVSGITEENLADAPTFDEAVQQVKDMLEEKILIGHGVDNDLRALGITHPWLMTRDTAYYQPFMRLLDSSVNKAATSETPIWGPRKLKDLSKEKLQRDIQVAGKSHCPVEDAAAALDLYKSHRPRWEACMSTEEKQQQQYVLQMAAAQAAYEAATLFLSSSNHQHGPRSHYSSSPPSSFAPSRSVSTSSSVSSVEDLSVSMHSYFEGPAIPPPPPGFDVPVLHTGYSADSCTGMRQQETSPFPLTFHSPLFHPSNRSKSPTNTIASKSSLDSWSHHGPISRPYHQSENDNTPYQGGRDYHSMKRQQQRPQLQRHVSLGYPTSYTGTSRVYSNSNGLYHNASLQGNAKTDSNTAVY